MAGEELGRETAFTASNCMTNYVTVNVLTPVQHHEGKVLGEGETY